MEGEYLGSTNTAVFLRGNPEPRAGAALRPKSQRGQRLYPIAHPRQMNAIR